MSEPWEDLRVRDGLTRQLNVRSGMIEAGAVSIGWKVGFGAPTSLQLMDITAPLLGFLTSATLRSDGAVVDASRWQRGIVEFEVAVHMGSDLGGDPSEREVRHAVSGIGPAIELANVDLPIGAESVADIMARNIFHEAVVLGENDTSRRGIDIAGCEARVLIDGRQRAATADLQALTGGYTGIVATVASSLASQGQRLRAGEVIITGSVVPPISVAEGRVFEFVLDPLDPISVVVA